MPCNQATQWFTLTSVDEMVEGRQEVRVESSAILEEQEVIHLSHGAPRYFRICICVCVLFFVQHSPDVGVPKCRVEVMRGRAKSDDVGCGTTVVGVKR